MSRYLNFDSLTETSEESSSCTSGSDSESFIKRIFRKKKLPKPTLRRSKRQGMCMMSWDESESSSDEGKNCIQQCQYKTQSNLIEMEDDPILENFIRNY